MNIFFKYLLVGFLVSFIKINGQQFSFKIVNDGDAVFKDIKYAQLHKNKSGAINELNNVMNELQQKGYLLAKADTLFSANELKSTIVTGDVFKWLYLKPGNLNPLLASKLGYSNKSFQNKPFNGKQFLQLKEKIIVYYENNGHPFASVSLDSLEINNNEIKASLNIKKNNFFKIDSVVIIGNAKINSSFINRYISVIPGKPYNEANIKTIGNKILQLPFLVQTQAQQVRLTEKTNKVVLFLNKKNASQFDGIVGVQPDNITGKTVITGDIKIKVVNGILHNAETFDVEWRRLQQQTQDFKGKFIYPYMFGTSFGSDYSLKIYKRDTTFIDINNDFGLHYYFSGLNYIKVHIKQRQSNLISTSGLENATVLPSYADVSSNLNGFGVFYEKLDYRFNPHKGISIQINASAGTKKIRKNPRINENAYTNIALSSAQYVYDATINGYIQLKGNSVLRLGLQSASIFGNAPVFKNELLRIGGLKTLRGFDEESIFTSFYAIPTIEYRFIFSQNSSLIAFTEGAFYENNSFGSYIKDTPFSFGAGMNLDTKAGILSINYALGSQFKQGIDARNGKIHFGLTALF